MSNPIPFNPLMMSAAKLVDAAETLRMVFETVAREDRAVGHNRTKAEANEAVAELVRACLEAWRKKP